MGIGVYVVAGDDHPENRLKNNAGSIILNNIPSSKEGADSLRALMSNTITHTLEIIPSCKCGNHKGSMAVLGNKPCSICNGFISTELVKPLDPMVFIRTPVNLDTGMQKGFILPNVWLMLSTAFSKGGFNLVSYLTDPMYKIKRMDKVQPLLSLLERDGIERGYKWFLENLGYIIKTCSNYTAFKNKSSVKGLYEFYMANKHNIHTDVIALPNRTLIPIEVAAIATYIDSSFHMLLDAGRQMQGIDDPANNFSDNKLSTIVSRMMTNLAEFYVKYTSTNVISKKGIWRSHIFKSRNPVSMYAVVSSIHGPHDAETIHIPWALTIQTYTTPITASLLERGYTVSEALAFIHDHTYHFSAEMREILDELLESFNGRLPIVMIRYPFLGLDSTALVWADRIKDDPSDLPVDMSPLIVNPFNGDFDGDKYIFVPLDDQYLVDAFQVTRVPFKIMSKTICETLNGNLMLTDPAIVSLTGWSFHSQDYDVSTKEDIDWVKSTLV